MCKALDDLYQEGIDKGYEKGLREGRMEQLTNLVKKLGKNMSVNEIAEILEEDVDMIEKLIRGVE